MGRERGRGQRESLSHNVRHAHTRSPTSNYMDKHRTNTFLAGSLPAWSLVLQNAGFAYAGVQKVFLWPFFFWRGGGGGRFLKATWSDILM